MPHDHIGADRSAISRQEGADMKHIPLDPSTLALVAATGVAGSLMSRHTAFFSPEGRISRRGLIGHGGLGLTVLATAGWRSYSARAAENGRSSVTLLQSGPTTPKTA